MFKLAMNLGIIIPIFLSIFREGQSVDHNPQPMNTVALLNSEAILRCHKDENVDIPVSWKFYDVGKTRNQNGLLISNRGRVHPPFNDTFLLNRISQGQFDLVIPSVDSKNAGIYECTKAGNNTPTAHLTIIDDPTCVVRVANGGTGLVHNGDTIHLSCTMHLTGHCQPTVVWTFDNGTFVGRSISNDTNSKNRTSISMFDFTVNSKRGNVSFIATVSFTCPKRSFHFNNLSTANPEYCHIWKSSAIEILDSFATSTAVTTSASDGDTLRLRDKLGVSFLAVIACGVLLTIIAKFRKEIRYWQRCKSQQSGVDIYDDIPRSKGSHSHSSSAKQFDWKEHSSSSNHVSDIYSMGYATSPRKISLPSLPKPESMDNELIATYAETRIFTSNIFMSCGSTSQLSQQRSPLVEDNASIYSKVIKPKPAKASELDSLSSKSSRSKHVIEDPHLNKLATCDTKYRHVGADGTTYSELNDSASQHYRRNLPSSPQVRQNKPIYADMDHTLDRIRARPPAQIPTLPPPD